MINLMGNLYLKTVSENLSSVLPCLYLLVAGLGSSSALYSQKCTSGYRFGFADESNSHIRSKFAAVLKISVTHGRALTSVALFGLFTT